MRVREVDERDSGWDDENPVFRVFVFRGGGRPGRGWATWTYDIDGADLIDVALWAQEEVGDSGLYAVALVSERFRERSAEPEKGLVWLIGSDANDRPLSDREAAAQARMHFLRGRRISIVD